MPVCERCHGTRKVKKTATEMRGKTVVRTWEYETECPRCLGAEEWREMGVLNAKNLSRRV